MYSLLLLSKSNKEENKNKNDKYQGEPNHSQVLQTVQSLFLPLHPLLGCSLHTRSDIGEQPDPGVLDLNLVAVVVQHGVEQDLRQGDEQAEDQPDVYHLDVGCSWHRVEHTDEERGEDEEEGDIHGDNDIKICRLPN